MNCLPAGAGPRRWRLPLGRGIDETTHVGGKSAVERGVQDGTASSILVPRHEGMVVLPVVEETVEVSKRLAVVGRVQVSTRTSTADEMAEIDLERSLVEVVRVPVGRVVEVAPDVRIEGDTTIMPVLEERLVVVKQLVLVEEVHVRCRFVKDVVQTSVALRRQHVVVKRLDKEGRPVDVDTGSKSTITEP